jgi:hypothetical protein
MRQTRRGAALKRRGAAYICPVDESEVKRDEKNHLYRIEGTKHPYLRVWEEWEIKS